ncbi:M1 family aminopeptidase [soil metagenome]
MPTLPSSFAAPVGTALVAAVVLFGTGGCEAAPDPDPSDEALVAPGVSHELARWRAATLSEISYDFDLRIPASSSDPVEGEALISFRWDDPDARPVVLDFAPGADQVEELTVNGDTLTPTEISAAFAHNHVRLPAALLRPGEANQVTLRFRAGDGPLNRREDLLYSLFVPARAHHALPIFDQPDLKAMVRWTLEIPEGWEAAANGGRAEVTTVTRADGTPGRRIRTPSTGPLAPYLMAFAAGVMDRVVHEATAADGSPRELVLFHRESNPARVEGNLGEIFRLHAEALDWLEEYTGIPYPYGAFEFVAIPAFQYGGMEHPGAISYRAESLFLEEDPTQAQLLGRASLIAHETAHMWFGNLVTMAWFDDVWTKEVFANFFAARIVNPAFPELDHELRFLLAHHPSAYAIDRTAGSHPIRQSLDNLDDAGSLYGAIIYQKAPVVMRQLERRLGEDAFRAGMRQYLAEHAHGNATWGGLIRILDAGTEQDLAAWSRDWVEEAGRPEIRVRRSTGSADPSWVLDPVADGARTWPQVLDPAVLAPGGLVSLPELPVAGASVGMTAAVWGAGVTGGDPQSPSLVLLPDAGGHAYALFRLEPDALAELLAAVAEPGGRLSGVARASALLMLHDAVLEGDLAPAPLAEALLARVPHESDEQLLGTMLGTLSSLLGRFMDAEARARLLPEVEAVLESELRQGESARRAASLFGAWHALARSEASVAWMRELWAGEARIPGFTIGETDRTTLAFELALREVPGWKVILDTEEARIEDPDRLARFRYLRPAVDTDPAVRDAFFQRLREPAERRREPWALQGLRWLSHPLRVDEAPRAAPAVAGPSAPGPDYITASLEMLEEIRETGDIFLPGRWVDAALAGHGSADAVRRVDAFLELHPDLPPRLREKVLQGVDPVRRAARSREQARP